MVNEGDNVAYRLWCMGVLAINVRVFEDVRMLFSWCMDFYTVGVRVFNVWCTDLYWFCVTSLHLCNIVLCTILRLCNICAGNILR